MDAKEYKKMILQKMKEALQPKGFKKNGNNFIRATDDLSYHIALQSSQSSTARQAIVTVNIEIASARISGIEDISVPIQHQRHYTRRIGGYLTPPTDKWWIADTNESAEIAAQEIVGLIEEAVLPNFDSLKTTDDLARLWLSRSGYTGITEGQRRNYLSLLGY